MHPRARQKRCSTSANEHFRFPCVQSPQMSKARRARTTVASKRTSKRTSKNQWLDIVAALDRTMKSRISEEDGVEARVKRGFSKPILTALNEAYATTLRYYAELLGGDSRNPKTESVLSGLWKQTGRLLRHHDPALSALLTTRDGCWSQDSTWSPSTIPKAWVNLNSIRVSANLMAPDRSAEKWGRRS